jgi:hypothetical protein
MEFLKKEKCASNSVRFRHLINFTDETTLLAQLMYKGVWPTKARDFLNGNLQIL